MVAYLVTFEGRLCRALQGNRWISPPGVSTPFHGFEAENGVTCAYLNVASPWCARSLAVCVVIIGLDAHLGLLRASWAVVGVLLGLLGCLFGLLGASWGALGASRGPSGNARGRI